ncbi:unnamed protein product [Ceutorhynchus assimilis]|uniref:BAG domain-containing protein n=1 Tax=Ceutorhynchus assimilis TaxID=467358 RepID=A0A9P0GNL5_9CUCU|nr:unnamed protein product [Ceutorhynchus assimilis]
MDWANWIMGNPQSKPEDRLRTISKEVNALRTTIKTSAQNISQARKEFLTGTLAHYSNEVKSLNGKANRQAIENTLKNLSDAMAEVLKIEPADLDGAAVESNSFVHVPGSHRRTSSLGSLRSSNKRATMDLASVNRSSVPNLRNIEAKVEELKTQIATAIKNQDSKQLRVYLTTIRLLVEDMEKIHTEKGTPLEKRKQDIDKKIMDYYRKVSEALSTLKKDNSSSKQYRKDKAMTELTDIEVHLAENESLLDKLIKEKNSTEFAAIRNNIVEDNQKLSKIDMVDNEVKGRVVLLNQKITETVNNLDRIMAKREFDSKFSNSLHNYERIVRNFDPNKNAEEIVINLVSLRNSIQNLEEINETTKSRKKDLLNKINYKLESFGKKLETDEQIIEEIVEENVVLRKHLDTEHTVIDQFVNHWSNIQTNFNVNAYSKLTLLRINSLLQEMQQSINEIRAQIADKCDINLPFSNLNRKLSQSVPKLNNRKSYQSLDQLDASKIIKTKAKIYNLSTPNIQSIQQTNMNNRFSKIEEVKMQVNYIKEKIDESHNKNLLRDKLEQYRKNLDPYLNDNNQTVRNNAVLVANEIVELLHKLILAEFKEKINLFSRRVQTFNGTRYDKEFDEIKEDLTKAQINLENFNIPTQFESLQQEKLELLDEVCNSIQVLQKNGTYYRKHENENVKQYKLKLNMLSDKVKRFSGTYKGVVYNNIERDLNKLLLDVGEQVEDKMSSDEIVKETERLLKILESRSSLAQSFHAKPDETKTEEQAGMAKIKRDLNEIKREIDKTAENNVDAFIGLQSRLDLVSLELGQIPARSNENLAKEMEIFSNETQTLKNVVDAKVALGQQPMVQWPERDLHAEVQTYPKNDVNKEIEQFEKAFSAIKTEITAPNNEQDVHKYYKLAQDIKNLMSKLHKYRFMRGTDLHTRQSTLLNEMQYYVEALEKGAIDVDYVLSIERKLDSLENLFDNNQQRDLKTMAKELQAVQNKLKEHHFNISDETLKNRKTSVQHKTDGLVEKLKQMETVEVEEIKKINDIEAKVSELAPQMSSFIGLKTENKYYELNETSTRLMLQLDKFETEHESIQKRIIKLLKDLHILGQMLDERAEQTREIVELEQELETIEHLLLSGNYNNIDVIKTRMLNLKKALQSLKIINDLVPRKNACIEKYIALFNKIMSLHTAETKVEDTSLDVIENEISKIEGQLDETSQMKQLQDFDDALDTFTLKIGSLNIPKSSPQYPKVLQLYRRIQNLVDAIEAKMQSVELVMRISREVDELWTKMEAPLTLDEINQLDERLIQLQDTLGKMNPAGIKAQIDGCMMRLILCLQKVSDYKATVQNMFVQNTSV